MLTAKRDEGLRELFEKHSVSLEAVDFQYNKAFHLALVGAVDVLMNTEGKPEDIRKSRIRDIVEEHLGLKIKFLVKENFLGACTTFPKLSKEHPLINDYRRGGWMTEDAVDKLTSSKTGVLKGEVDLKNSKVSGVFSDIECTIWLGDKLLKKQYRFSAEEVAAVIAHELGHIFEYCSLSARVTTTNFIIKTSMDRVIGSDDRKKRIAVLDNVETALGVKLDDKERLVDSKSKDVYQTVILSKAVEASRSELGENIYDYRGFEALADQFAVRHGFAVPLATGLDKIQRTVGHGSYRSTAMFAFIEVCKLWFFLLSVNSGNIILPFGNFLLPIYLVMSNPLVSDYDKPERRNNRIRDQLREALKDKTLPDDVRESILKDITVIDTINESVKDRTTLREFFWTNVMPSGRRQKASMRLQEDLEELIQNELFESAAKLKQLERS